MAMEQTRIRKTGTGFHVSRRRLWLSLALLPAAVAWLHHFVARIRSSSAGPDKALSAAPSEPARNQLEQRLRESLVAIAEAPADPVRKLEHSRLLYEAGNWTEAIQWVDQAISQSPDDGQVLEEARLLKGRVAFLLGDYRSALEYFRRAYETSVDPAIQLRMELACIHMNDYESAAKVGRTPVSPVVSRLA
jgi:tetratricopeptide (TPR) repeat protein